MQALKHMKAATHTNTLEYLLIIYGQNHYNAVWYNTKIKTKGNNKIRRKKQNTQINNKNCSTQKRKRKVRGNKRKRKKTKKLVKRNIKTKHKSNKKKQ